MPVLLPWVVAQAITMLLLASVFGYLSRATEWHPLRFWAIGFGAGAIGTAAAGYEVVVAESAAWTLPVAGGAMIVSAAAILKASALTVGREVPRIGTYAIVGAVVFVPVGWLLGLGSVAATVPLAMVSVVALILAGVRIASASEVGIGRWLSGGGLVGLGVHVLDYPLFAANPENFSWGYLISIVLHVTTAIGLLMGTFESTNRVLLKRERELAGARRIEAIGRLAGGVAHDFNNLLTVIVGSLYVLENPEPGSKPEESLDAIRTATKQASRLTAQLLVLGRQTVLHPAPTDLRTLIEETGQMMSRILPSNVEFEISNLSRSLWVKTDRGSVEQLLTNLIANARDALPSSGGRIQLRVSCEDGELVLDVEDTGGGMDAETIKRVFEPFFTTKGSGEGTGLGMATVHGIVTQLGGDIAVASEVDEGTKVRIHLPIVEAPPAESTATARGRSARRILVVEDEPAVRRIATLLLKRAGCEVIAVEDGQSAIDHLKEDSAFDLVLSDCVMPRLGGIELARRLANEHPELPVLLVSGHPLGDELPEGAHYLAKPYAQEDLLAAIDASIRASVALTGGRAADALMSG